MNITSKKEITVKNNCLTIFLERKNRHKCSNNLYALINFSFFLDYFVESRKLGEHGVKRSSGQNGKLSCVRE